MYEQIRRYVRAHYGIVAQSRWIAEVRRWRSNTFDAPLSVDESPLLPIYVASSSFTCGRKQPDVVGCFRPTAGGRTWTKRSFKYTWLAPLPTKCQTNPQHYNRYHRGSRPSRDQL